MSKRKALVVATLATALVTATFSTSVLADQYSDKIFEENRVSGSAMALDAVAVRPLMLGFTAVGTVLFVAAAPFALAGGSVGATWDTLVSTAAENTFVRCLGCTPVQHQRREADRKTALAGAESAEAK